jgi:hypothetical protein
MPAKAAIMAIVPNDVAQMVLFVSRPGRADRSIFVYRLVAARFNPQFVASSPQIPCAPDARAVGRAFFAHQSSYD